MTSELALVTGSGRGIGEAIAHGLADAGYHVLVNDVDATSAERVAGKVAARCAPGATAVPGDISSASEVAQLFARLEPLGRLSVLVNNAAIGHPPTPTPEVPPATAARMLEINLLGQYLCAKAAFEQMLDHRGGRIVNIGSRAWLGSYGQAAYSATKGGTISLTRSLALETNGTGITVNAVVPGSIETPAFAELPTSVRRSIEELNPVRRLGRPDEIARAVLLFCGAGAESLNGQVLHVCGGRSLMSQPDMT